MARFKGEVVAEAALQLSSLISTDGQDIKISFDNLDLISGRAQGQPLTATRAATLILPITKNDKLQVVRQDIRGIASIDHETRAVLAAHHAGQFFVLDLPESPCFEEQFSASFLSTVPALAEYRLTLFLLVERDSDDTRSAVQLALSSLRVVLADGEEPSADEADQLLQDRPWLEFKGNALDRIQQFEQERGIGLDAVDGLQPEALGTAEKNDK